MKRETRQRRAIRQVVMTATFPLSPVQVMNEAQKIIPKLGLATVYRTIKDLLEENVIREVHICGDAPRYELVSKGHHHHFYCFGCGKIFEISGCHPEVNDLVPAGFTQDFHELTFYGCCKDCTAKNALCSAE
jgi:Fur family transcriptional regulator, ferric uptake regulator